MNLFIESIEGGTYVVATGEQSADTYLRDKYSNSMQFQSIETIKNQVEGQRFDKVWLKQSTPYDEMCGLESDNQPLIIELDWR